MRDFVGPQWHTVWKRNRTQLLAVSLIAVAFLSLGLFGLHQARTAANDLGDIFWYTLPSSASDKGEIIQNLDRLNAVEDEALHPDTGTSWKNASRGFRFSQRGSVLVVESGRLGFWTLRAIRADIDNDRPAQVSMVMPKNYHPAEVFKVVPEEYRSDAEEGSTWSAWIATLRKAGFDSIEFTNGTRAWRITLASSTAALR